MIPRHAAPTLSSLARTFPILALTGPRQSGKTTLARAVFADKPYVSLEDPDALEFAQRDPRAFLARFSAGAVLDEVQRCPSLFSYLQTLSDEVRRPGEWILTGSQQFGLLSGITQSLAGRVGMLHLLPLSVHELTTAGIGAGSLDELMWRGLYPGLYDRPHDPEKWYADYLVTYLERDVRALTAIHDLMLFQRFVRLCAARTGQLLNLNALAVDAGISHVTARAWLTILEASYVVHLLRPHHRNFGKRLVKTPKLYFYDVGLATALLGIQDPQHLGIHSSRGALFETLVVGEFLKVRMNAGRLSNVYFWRDHVGLEVDVVLEHRDELLAVEVRSGRTLASDSLASLHKWQAVTSGASELHLVYGGDDSYEREGVKVHSWRDV